MRCSAAARSLAHSTATVSVAMARSRPSRRTVVPCRWICRRSIRGANPRRFTARRLSAIAADLRVAAQPFQVVLREQAPQPVDDLGVTVDCGVHPRLERGGVDDLADLPKQPFGVAMRV
jgi:hypothetical protein